MGKWNLFGKPKEEKTETKPPETEEKKEEKNKAHAEYRETLQTGKSTKKQSKNTDSNVEQRVWRDVDSIEDKVDNLHITRAQKPATEVDRTVDKLIQKRKKK